MKHKYLGISLASFVLLTACGQAAPASSSPDVLGKAPSGTASAAPIPDAVTLPQASDVFDQVTWVEEWQPGQYLINGLDETNASICGILDDMGQVQLFEGYASVYPLADGKMVASQQPVDTHTAEMGINVEVQALQGNIVDTDGNILYEADDTQWLYVLNPETIFVVRASTGFEGDVIEFGVLNQNGEFIQEWRETDVIPIGIEEGQALFDSVRTELVRNVIPNGPVLFSIGVQYGADYNNTLYYWSKTQDILGWQDISEILPKELQSQPPFRKSPRLYGDKLILEDSVVYNSDGSYYPLYEELTIGDPESVTMTPEIQQLLDEGRYPSMYQLHYLGSVLQEEEETAVFAASGVFYFSTEDTDDLRKLDTKTMYLLGEDGGEIPFDEEYADAITSVEVGENKLIATLKNSEGDFYVASFSADGTILEGPYPLEGMSLCGVDGDRLLLSDYQRTVAVWDANTGKEYIRFSWEDQDGEFWGAYWLSDEWVLVCLYNYDETNTGGCTYAIYDMDGNRVV